ncbi:MAG TPA: hypothetical protein VFG69_11090, partial [Nannocystaceae bacterium]|nr:hypothetical protein [Nannocystaceae bacterium]
MVVACVGGDPAPIQPALDVLSARGLVVDVLAGSEVRPSALVEHGRRHGADALFVLATFGEGPADVEPLTAALR